MCPYQAKFTIFRVLTLLLLLGGAVCVVCNVSVCALCGYVQCVCVVCFGVLLVFCWCVWLCVLVCVVVCVVMVCRTRYQDHGIYFHIDVHVGVTLFVHFHIKKQSKTLSVHAYHLEVILVAGRNLVDSHVARADISLALSSYQSAIYFSFCFLDNVSKLQALYGVLPLHQLNTV